MTPPDPTTHDDCLCDCCGDDPCRCTDCARCIEPHHRDEMNRVNDDLLCDECHDAWLEEHARWVGDYEYLAEHRCKPGRCRCPREVA